MDLCVALHVRRINSHKAGIRGANTKVPFFGGLSLVELGVKYTVA